MKREKIKTINFDISLETESFQNEVVRPILKSLNEILLKIIFHQLLSRNRDFNNLNKEKKSLAVQHLFSKDNNFRNLLKGMIIGSLDQKELDTFLSMEKEMTKRVLQMSEERFISQLF